MSSPLVDVWEAAAASPFSPAVGKNTQFTVGFVLLAMCTLEALLCSAALLGAWWSYTNDAQPSS
jgi:hypothetical protein